MELGGRTDECSQLHAMVASEECRWARFRLGAPHSSVRRRYRSAETPDEAFPNLRVEVTTGLSPTLLESSKAANWMRPAWVLRPA